MLSNLWCWKRLLRVPWTVRKSNQSILKEMHLEYSLEGLMVKLKLQYFGHLMGRANSLENPLMLGNTEGLPPARLTPFHLPQLENLASHLTVQGCTPHSEFHPSSGGFWLHLTTCGVLLPFQINLTRILGLQLQRPLLKRPPFHLGSPLKMVAPVLQIKKQGCCGRVHEASIRILCVAP